MNKQWIGNNNALPSGTAIDAYQNTMRSRMMFLFANLIGSQVSVELKNGTLYSGIFHTFKEEGGIVLRMAYSESNHSQTSKIPYILIMDADIVRITAKNVSFASETQNNTFMTDTAISNSALNMERPLEKWMPEEEDIDNSLTLDTGKKQPVWDQFKENERKFGVKTDFNMDDYTTKLDKNSKDYKKKEAQAERLAREIEKSATSNIHMAEERGMLLDDSQMDEEDRYGAVVRNPGSYIPPPLRKSPTEKKPNSKDQTEKNVKNTSFSKSENPKIIETLSINEKKHVDPHTQPKQSASIKHIQDEKKNNVKIENEKKNNPWATESSIDKIKVETKNKWPAETNEEKKNTQTSDSKMINNGGKIESEKKNAWSLDSEKKNNAKVEIIPSEKKNNAWGPKPTANVASITENSSKDLKPVNSSSDKKVISSIKTNDTPSGEAESKLKSPGNESSKKPIFKEAWGNNQSESNPVKKRQDKAGPASNSKNTNNFDKQANNKYSQPSQSGNTKPLVQSKNQDLAKNQPLSPTKSTQPTKANEQSEIPKAEKKTSLNPKAAAFKFNFNASEFKPVFGSAVVPSTLNDNIITQQHIFGNIHKQGPIDIMEKFTRAFIHSHKKSLRPSAVFVMWPVGSGGVRYYSQVGPPNIDPYTMSLMMNQMGLPPNGIPFPSQIVHPMYYQQPLSPGDYRGMNNFAAPQFNGSFIQMPSYQYQHQMTVQQQNMYFGRPNRPDSEYVMDNQENLQKNPDPK